MVKVIIWYLNDRYGKFKNIEEEVLEYEIFNDFVVYLGIYIFGNGEIRVYLKEKKLSVFLRNSFKFIYENDI